MRGYKIVYFVSLLLYCLIVVGVACYAYIEKSDGIAAVLLLLYSSHIWREVVKYKKKEPWL
ncbi:MAG: hypothetical protein KatS3mg031_2843 [Chitinophagales bacterium]|nr:MAG: hypothetical protein KatS3mg031_2843 [Chitinophagales bacterium]